MSRTFFNQTLIIIAIILVVIGFLFSLNTTLGPNETVQCNLTKQQKCELVNNAEFITVEFLQDIELEEELNLHILTSPTLKIKKMWVQGVNMYMGKTAVLIDNVKETSFQKSYQGVLFLGACSEPNMKWQLIILTESQDKGEQSWFFNFDTSRN
ncbi:MAG: hypothetical protein ABJH06_09695 [Paraglaciecola sp.]|uniref:hypothetical protein n=1 Tax=Paraglaciecola sp. TaxID=1920173 RepID=UPI003299EA7B